MTTIVDDRVNTDVVVEAEREKWEWQLSFSSRVRSHSQEDSLIW